MKQQCKCQEIELTPSYSDCYVVIKSTGVVVKTEVHCPSEKITDVQKFKYCPFCGKENK